MRASEKEDVAIKENNKEHKTKHKSMEVFQCGLFTDKQYPCLRASPGRIQVYK